jgi:hypothetical protein
VTVERAALVKFWPLVDIGKLALRPGDTVVIKSKALDESNDLLREFVHRFAEAFPGVTPLVLTNADRLDFVVRRAMPDMRAEDLIQPERKGTME